MTLVITPEAGFLRVTASGEFSLQDATRTFVELLDAVARYGRVKVLFDGRQILGEPATMERFYYGEFAARSVAQFALHRKAGMPRFAYVLRPPVLDSSRLGETVALNRGMSVKAADSIDDAFAWLGLAPPGDPGSC